MKNKFIRRAGDMALYIAIIMLCVAGLLNTIQREKLKDEVDSLNTQIQELSAVNAEIKYEQEQYASQTDARLQLISEKVNDTKQVLANTNHAISRINKRINNQEQKFNDEIEELKK